jgi:hypothetical protein
MQWEVSLMILFGRYQPMMQAVRSRPRLPIRICIRVPNWIIFLEIRRVPDKYEMKFSDSHIASRASPDGNFRVSTFNVTFGKMSSGKDKRIRYQNNIKIEENQVSLP